MEDAVLGESDLSLKLVDSPVELFASVGFEQAFQLRVTELPDFFFYLGVVNVFDRCVHFVVEGLIGDQFAAGLVHLVFEAWVVRILDTIPRRKNSFSDVV